MPRLPRTSPLIPLVLLFACASSPQGAEEPVAPAVESTPAPVEALPPQNQPSIVVASIRLVGDCTPSSPDDPVLCMGASLNLKIHNNGERPQKIAIRSVKLVRPDHEAVLADLQTGTPQRWEDAGYRSWDEFSQPGREDSILYDLSVPSWSDVEAKIGEGSNSFGQPFRLVIEVSVDGEVTTLFSPTALREYEDIVVT